MSIVPSIAITIVPMYMDTYRTYRIPIPQIYLSQIPNPWLLGRSTKLDLFADQIMVQHACMHTA